MTNWTELKRLAEEAGGIEWHADMAVANDGAESRAIYHRPKPYHVVEIIETPDSALDNADCIHSESVWQYIAAANPKTILALIAENEQYQEIMRVFVEEATCADWSGEDNESVFHTAQMWCGKYHQAKQDADQLRAEVETLRKDAERWRFLCDGDHQMIIAQMTEFDGVCEIGCDPIEYDFAIDSMMEKNA